MTEGLLVTHQKIQNYVRRRPHWKPPTPKIAQNVLRVFTKGVKFIGVTSGGVTDKGSDTDKYPDALSEPTPAVQGVDTGVGKPPQYVLIPLYNVFYLDGPQRLSYRH